jgi:hypothetical protein
MRNISSLLTVRAVNMTTMQIYCIIVEKFVLVAICCSGNATKMSRNLLYCFVVLFPDMF